MIYHEKLGGGGGDGRGFSGAIAAVYCSTDTRDAVSIVVVVDGAGLLDTKQTLHLVLSHVSL